MATTEIAESLLQRVRHVPVDRCPVSHAATTAKSAFQKKNRPPPRETWAAAGVGQMHGTVYCTTVIRCVRVCCPACTRTKYTPLVRSVPFNRTVVDSPAVGVPRYSVFTF